MKNTRESQNIRPPKVQANQRNSQAKKLYSDRALKLLATDVKIFEEEELKLLKLITNNTDFFHKVKAVELINGSSLDVLINVRSLVHFGSEILTHPLCGNLRPNHQPFRSVIIDEKNGLVDLESLSLIEEAVHVYQSCKLIYPNEIEELTRKDYAYIDFELMRESLIHYSLLKEEF